MNFRVTPELLEFFLSPSFGAVELRLKEIAEKYSDPLTIQTRLREALPRLPAAHAAAAMAMRELRLRASHRLALHPASLYHAETLEQASSGPAAAYHASLLAGHPRVADLCAGVGSDTAALASSSEAVSAVEADPVTAGLLAWNMHLLGHTNVRIETATVEEWLARGGADAVDAIWADPSRRSGGRRHVDASDYSPPLTTLAAVAATRPVVVKIAPAATIGGGFWRKGFVAVHDECSEQLLCSGIDVPPVFVAHAESGAIWAPAPDSLEPPDCVDPSVLIEPHNAVVRSGLVREHLATLGATPVDPHIAYGLAAALPPPGPLHRSFIIIDRMPFSVRALRTRLRELRWGPATEIKKRGFPLLPDELRRLLAPVGDNPGVLICTRQGDAHIVYLCTREPGGNAS